MAITNITVSNFKSFKQLDLALGRFNVVIGANAAGKSNFVEIFKFLRDLEQNGLEDAVFMHGGQSSLLSRRLGPAQDLRVRAVSDDQMDLIRPSRCLRVYETIYELAVRFSDEATAPEILADNLLQKFETYRLELEELELEEKDGPADKHPSDRQKGEISVRILDGKRVVGLEPPDLGMLLEKEQVLPPVSLMTEFSSVFQGTTSLVIQANHSVLVPWQTLFSGIGVYSIDPRAAKEPCAIRGKPELHETGTNLALILKQTLADRERSRRFHNLMHDLLPFVTEVGTQNSPDGAVLANLKEDYYSDPFLAHLLSDGTINIAALITALFFQDNDVVIIEEPERNIHPRLISGMMELMKDASRNKQIIVTTHSPEVVKHAGVENLLLISRDKEGFSTISRPAEKEAVKVFLEHELGLDDLFVQDLLAVP